MQRQPPMTLGNMCANGVRTLVVWCMNVNCRHERIVNVDAYGDDVFVPSLGLRMRYQLCGQRGPDVRPNWNERTIVGAFDGRR
jgi:hypothetical protein